MGPMNLTRRDIPALCFLLFVPLWVSTPCLLGLTYAQGDLQLQFFPWKELGLQAAQAGRLPLWNPTVLCGMPLLGNFQSGLLYPGGIFFYLLSFPNALGIHLGLHFFLAGSGAYVLARVLGLERGPALVAALAFQGNAFLLNRLQFISALSAIAWTSWILAALAEGWMVLPGILIGLQLLAGYPPTTFYACLAGLLLAAAGPSWKKDSFRLAGAVLIGAAISAPLLLPGLELMSRSVRAAGIFQKPGGLSLGDLWGWLYPEGFRQDPLYWSKAFYPGWMALALVPVAFLAPVRGRLRFWAVGLTVAGLLLAFDLGKIIKPLALNRHPALALEMASLGLALLAGCGMAQVAKVMPRTGTLAALGVGAVLLFDQLGTGWVRPPLAGVSVYAPAASAMAMKPLLGAGRFLVSPAVQNQSDARGPSLTLALRQHAEHLRANTASPVGLKDANGYDPLAPAAVVYWLNKAAFPEFGTDQAALDILGVSALVDWDPASRGRIGITRRPHPWRAEFLATPMPGGKTPLPAALPLVEAAEENRISLPQGHGPGTVVLTDTFYPGWKAWVDGVPTPIQIFAGAFRSVEVGSQAREVVYRYRPPLFMASLAASVGFVVLLCAVGMISAILHKKEYS